MDSVRDKWTDERLDDLNLRVDDGFRRVDKRLDRFEEQVGERFDKVDERFDKVDRQFERLEVKIDRMGEQHYGLSRMMIYGAFTLSGAMLTGFIAVFTLIATKF